jgi:uncharacterized membrane protein (UPF0127 family)
MTARPARARGRDPRRLALLALFALLPLGFTACPESEPEAFVPSAEIRGQVIQLELTRTRAEMSRGLGYRDALAWDHGMLFQYPRPDFYGFWMKGMRFDIDIIWIREGRIVDISHRVPFHEDGPGPTMQPREVIDTVLEVPSGYSQARGFRIGDPVILRLSDPVT